MKNVRTLFLLLVLFLIVPIICNTNAFADPSGGGRAATSVSTTVHSAADIVTLSKAFNNVMDAYNAEGDERIKRDLLEKARAILAKLIEQANNVESEISILAKKKLHKVYLDKLERVLSVVVEMRETARRRALAAEQPG